MRAASWLLGSARLPRRWQGAWPQRPPGSAACPAAVRGGGRGSPDQQPGSPPADVMQYQRVLIIIQGFNTEAAFLPPPTPLLSSFFTPSIFPFPPSFLPSPLLTSSLPPFSLLPSQKSLHVHVHVRISYTHMYMYMYHSSGLGEGMSQLLGWGKSAWLFGLVVVYYLLIKTLPFQLALLKGGIVICTGVCNRARICNAWIKVV